MKNTNLSWKKVCALCENDFDCRKVKNNEEAKAYFNSDKTKIKWLVAVADACDFMKRGYNYTETTKREYFLGLFDNLVSFDFSETVELDDEPVCVDNHNIEDIYYVEDISIKDIEAYIRRKDNDFEDIDLDVSTPKIYENVPVEFQDEFLIKYDNDIFPGLIAICLDNNNVVAKGYLQKDEDGRYRVILKQKDIKYDKLDGNTQFRIILFKKTLKDAITNDKKINLDDYNDKLFKLNCNIEYLKMDTTDNTLCIDFGTSNTSAGSYSILDPEEDNIELVSFTDVTSEEMKEVKVLPTIVYVDDCSNKDKIKYIFGYEAKKIVSDKEYDTTASVFFEIKRWIGTLDEDQQIKDSNGKTLTVKRRDIVKAYLEHIIALSEQYFKRKFKTLHFSAPVKLKEKFNNEIKCMLSDSGYSICEPDSTLDEGIAIIYNSISKLIASGKITASKDDEELKPTKIMILDCGGGTTDLASCEVRYQEYKAANKLHITTKFVNGNSNFGGNNITFRIMQLLKIKLASKFNKDFIGDCDTNKLIPMEENAILNEIEKSYDSSDDKQYNSDTANTIYSEFIKYYEKAEEVIPTIFVDNKNCKFAGELRKIKRNYYYLWQLAEKIKIQFYDADDVQIYFDPNDDKAIKFDTPQNYYLYVRKQGELEKIDKPADDIIITIKELRRILYGDIYGLINELLKTEGLKIDDYNYYRLAGQSCKINLFMELLKEFIPGNKLRIDSSQHIDNFDSNSSIKLKLDCITGSISYIRDKECGHINPEMETDKPKLIYDVYTRAIDNKNLLIAKDSKKEKSSETKKLKFVAFTQKSSKAEIFVNNIFGNTERKLSIQLPDTGYEKSNLDSLFKDIKNKSFLDESIIDKLKNEIMGIKPSEYDSVESVRIIFAIPSKEGYGMNIYRFRIQIEGDEHIFGTLPMHYENFENESTKSFFDGRR